MKDDSILTELGQGQHLPIFFVLIFKELLNKDVALLFDIKRERGLIFNGGVQRWSTPTFNERLDNSLVYINKAVVTCAGLYHGIENVHPFRGGEGRPHLLES